MRQHIYPSSIVGLVLGGLCLFYFILIQVKADLSGGFRFVWLAAAIYFFGFGVLGHFYNNELIQIPRGFYWLFVYFASAVIVLIGVSIGVLNMHNNDMPKENADYIIVLGSKCNTDEPTETLQYRLDGAVTYLEANPDTQVIVSGGKVGGEIYTESSIMKEYLEDQGIDRMRILEEDTSTNTKENLEYSSALIEDPKASVVIVTSSFHVYRALEMAEDAGMTRVSGLGTASDPLLIPYNYVREAVAVIKYRIGSIL